MTIDFLPWVPPSPEAEKHSGPREAPCVICGKQIEGYESRFYGESGAVHYDCGGSRMDERLRGPFPYYYTDG